MAIVTSIRNVETDTLEILLPVIDRTAWDETARTFDKASKASEAVYHMNVTDKNYPCEIRLGVYPNLSKGSQNISARFETYVTAVNDVTDEVIWEGVIAGTLAFTLPVLHGVISESQFLALLGNLVSIYISGATSGVINTGVIGKLNNGQANIVLP